MTADTLYYSFTFSPVNAPPNMNMVYKVVTDDEEMMNLFLKQHRFLSMIQNVQVINPGEEIDYDDPEVLHKYRFGSNKDRHNIYEIVTSQQFIQASTIDAGDSLSTLCIFGNMVSEDNIPIIEIFKKNISDVPFATIMDLDDGYSAWVAGMSTPVKRYNMYQEDEAPDDSLIYDALLEMSDIQEIVQPITMEAYIEYFVSMMTDTFDE